VPFASLSEQRTHVPYRPRPLFKFSAPLLHRTESESIRTVRHSCAIPFLFLPQLECSCVRPALLVLVSVSWRPASRLTRIASPLRSPRNFLGNYHPDIRVWVAFVFSPSPSPASVSRHRAPSQILVGHLLSHRSPPNSDPRHFTSNAPLPKFPALASFTPSSHGVSSSSSPPPLKPIQLLCHHVIAILTLRLPCFHLPGAQSCLIPPLLRLAVLIFTVTALRLVRRALGFLSFCVVQLTLHTPAARRERCYSSAHFHSYLRPNHPSMRLLLHYVHFCMPLTNEEP